MTQEMLISVVIVNYNRQHDLRAAVASVHAQDYLNTEIIVVDNASTDGSLAMLQAEFPEVKTIALTRNIGMDGYSVACRAAKGEIIFQMDNDSLMPDTTVLSNVAVGFAQAPNDVAILATRVEEYRVDRDDIEGLRKRDQRHGPLKTLGFHSGGAAFRRLLMEQVGYYNEDVFLYGAELFLQASVIGAGFKLVLYPDILMLHKSSGTARSGKGLYYETRNRYWFMRYYATRWQRIRHLPWMVLHDLFYSVHRRAFRLWIKSLVDGFGTMPESLKPPFYSQIPDFVHVVEKVGQNFSPAVTLARLVSRVNPAHKLRASAKH